MLFLMTLINWNRILILEKLISILINVHLTARGHANYRVLRMQFLH